MSSTIARQVSYEASACLDERLWYSVYSRYSPRFFNDLGDSRLIYERHVRATEFWYRDFLRYQCGELPGTNERFVASRVQLNLDIKKDQTSVTTKTTTAKKVAELNFSTSFLMENILSKNNADNNAVIANHSFERYELPRAFPASVTRSRLSSARKMKKFVCSYPGCEVTCANFGQLKGHYRVHTGERPFQCDYDGCGKKFARNEELTRHRRIHTGLKPHQCPECLKKFGRKDHLNKHRKTHLKVAEKKTCACSVTGCMQRYTRSDALARHIRSAHGDCVSDRPKNVQLL